MDKTVLTTGSVVLLKQGLSPTMIVNKKLDDNYVECIWFNGTIIKKEVLHEEVLIEYDEKFKFDENMTEEEAANLYMEMVRQK